MKDRPASEASPCVAAAAAVAFERPLSFEKRHFRPLPIIWT